MPVVVSVTIRNYGTSDDWVLISSNSGVNLFAGNNEDATGMVPEFLPELGESVTFYAAVPDTDLVYEAKHDLLKSLSEAGLQPDLIQSDWGAGYRLAARPGRIRIVLFDDEEGRLTWG